MLNGNPEEKLVWIDMEMTGLDVEKEVPIEVAVVIADFKFKVFEEYEAVIKQPQSILEKMDEWNRTHHSKSGLLSKIPKGKEMNVVEDEIMALVKKHCPTDVPKGARPVLAGNSIMQDRLFINKYMPRFNSLLHYRMLDVTSWKIVFNHKYGRKYDKKNQHRALDDIHESINELKFYMSFLNVK